MAVLISDELLSIHNLSEKALREELACILYDKEILSIGQASRMAELDRISFQKALADRDIDIKLDQNDLLQDLQTLKNLKLYGNRE